MSIMSGATIVQQAETINHEGVLGAFDIVLCADTINNSGILKASNRITIVGNYLTEVNGNLTARKVEIFTSLQDLIMKGAQYADGKIPGKSIDDSIELLNHALQLNTDSVLNILNQAEEVVIFDRLIETFLKYSPQQTSTQKALSSFLKIIGAQYDQDKIPGKKGEASKLLERAAELIPKDDMSDYNALVREARRRRGGYPKEFYPSSDDEFSNDIRAKYDSDSDEVDFTSDDDASSDEFLGRAQRHQHDYPWKSHFSTEDDLGPKSTSLNSIIEVLTGKIPGTTLADACTTLEDLIKKALMNTSTPPLLDMNSLLDKVLESTANEIQLKNNLTYILAILGNPFPDGEFPDDQLEDTILYYEKLLAINPDFEVTKILLSKALNSLGLYYCSGEAKEKTIVDGAATLERAYALSPSELSKTNLVGILNTLSFECAENKIPEKGLIDALAYLEKGYAIDPNYEPIKTNLVGVLNILGVKSANNQIPGKNILDACNYLERAVTLDPNKGAIKDNFVNVAFQAGQLIMLGQIKKICNNKAVAKTWLQKARQYAPNNQDLKKFYHMFWKH